MINAYKVYAHTLMWLCDLPKRNPDDTVRTTIIVDKKLWKRFLTYIVKEYGTAKKASVEAEAAIREYLDKHEK